MTGISFTDKERDFLMARAFAIVTLLVTGAKKEKHYKSLERTLPRNIGPARWDNKVNLQKF